MNVSYNKLLNIYILHQTKNKLDLLHKKRSKNFIILEYIVARETDFNKFCVTLQTLMNAIQRSRYAVIKNIVSTQMALMNANVVLKRPVHISTNIIALVSIINARFKVKADYFGKKFWNFSYTRTLFSSKLKLQLL